MNIINLTPSRNLFGPLHLTNVFLCPKVTTIDLLLQEVQRILRSKNFCESIYLLNSFSEKQKQDLGIEELKVQYKDRNLKIVLS